MRRTTSLAYVGLLAAAALAPGCGGDQTTASKSAAAFDEAQRKGAAPSGGEAHGQHGAAEDTKAGSAARHDAPAPHTGHDTQGGPQAPRKASDMAGMDHANMPGMAGAHASRPGTGSARAQPHAGHANAPTAGTDHSNMPGMAGAHGVRPGSTAAGATRQPPGAQGTGASAGMDHANMPGMDHSRMAQAPGGAAPPVPERPAAAASPEQLVATLRPDPLDVPEPTSLREAARAAEIAQQMAGGGHGMSHGTYRQIDAGREEVRPKPSGHEGHQMTPAPPPPSSADPHAGHSAPATTAPAQAAPAPSADPHAGHATPAAPRPNPTPSPRPTPTPRPKQDNR